MSTSIKAIVFDLGGVLVDWNPRYLYRKIFDSEKEIEWFLENICNMDWNEEQDAGRPLAAATNMKILEHPEWAEHIKAYYERWPEMLGDAIPNTLAILNDLKQNKEVRLLALTNWSAETFPVAQKKFEFLQCFDGIVVSGVEGTRKPKNEIYQILFDRYAVDPAEALFIDDNLRNVEAAQALGMRSIHFKPNGTLRKQLIAAGVNL